MLQKLAIFLMLFLPALANAEAAKSDAAARQLIESVMGKVSAGNYVDALVLLGRFSPNIAPGQDQILGLQIKSERDQNRATFGSVVGYEFVREEKPSPSLWRLYYLEKGSISGAAWIFTLYKSQEGWVVPAFTMQSKVETLFGGPL